MSHTTQQNPTTGNEKFSGLLTPSQAIERGIPWKTEPPPAEQCQFCGAVLEPDGLCLFGQIIMWRPENIKIRCTCKEATEYWKQYDLEQQKKAEEKAKEEERRMHIKKIKELLSDSGMGERFRKRTFNTFITDTPERKKCFDIAVNYVENFEMNNKLGKGLYFEGSNGTGKTHLAAAITLRLISNGVPVIFKTCADLLSDVKEAYDSKDKRDQEIMNIYKTVDLLVIDDLGKERCTDWSMSVLYQIVNARYENNKPIIITTNYSHDGLIKAMTPNGSDATRIKAIISRLFEMSTKVQMIWDDIRRNT